MQLERINFSRFVPKMRTTSYIVDIKLLTASHKNQIPQIYNAISISMNHYESIQYQSVFWAL